MNLRQNTLAVLNYEKYDALPIVYFGYWRETLEKWCKEGHVSKEEHLGWRDGNEYDKAIGKRIGFDYNWFTCATQKSTMGDSKFTPLYPNFEIEVIEKRADGSYIMRDSEGVIVMKKEGATSIPTEIEHTLKDRASWEKYYLPKLQYTDERIDNKLMEELLKKDAERDTPLGVLAGSLLGQIRNWIGFENMSYMYADDQDLLVEIIDTVGDLAYKVMEKMLSFGIKFDYAHYWEDICYKNGPLVVPSFFAKAVGPHYTRISKLLNDNGVGIISLDCDGWIDTLVPIWLENGVNTMFPIEVGTWGASIAPWREKYGREIRGVGGMNKNVLSADYAAIDREIERLKPLVELGGYIPCPDHRIAPDAKYENVQYYCERMRETFNM